MNYVTSIFSQHRWNFLLLVNKCTYDYKKNPPPNFILWYLGTPHLCILHPVKEIKSCRVYSRFEIYS